jgi:hypothetical protein
VGVLGDVLLTSHHSAIAMNVPTPWVPSWNGDPLSTFKELQDVLEDKLVPIPTRDGAWAKQTLKPALLKIPANGREAVWESVLALWRLDYATPRDDGSKSLWQQFTSAWLVRDQQRLSGEWHI